MKLNVVAVSSVLKREGKFWDMTIDTEERYQDKEKKKKASQERCWKRDKERKVSVWALRC